MKQLGVLIVHIHAGLNNTIITLTEENGNTLAWRSCGSMGFKNCKKSTPHSNSSTFTEACKLIKKINPLSLRIKISGVGLGAQSIGTISKLCSEIPILEIEEMTAVAFNGVSPRRPRRV